METADKVFVAALKEMTESTLNLMKLFQRADNLKNMGAEELAIELYRIWIGFNHANPLLFAAHFNLAVMQTNRGDLAAAQESLRQAITHKPDFYPAHINLGGVFEKSGAVSEAVAQRLTIVDALPQITGANKRYKIEALKQVGRVLEERREYGSQTEDMLRQVIDLDHTQNDAIEHFVMLRLGQCKWPVVVPWEDVSA